MDCNASVEKVSGLYIEDKRRRRRSNTVDGYASSIGRHVLPTWGDRAIGSITRDEVQDWVDELAKDAGPGGAWKAYKCLRQMIRWAMRKWGLFMADPTLGIERPRCPAYKPEVLTVRRLKRLVRGMVGCECEPSFILSASLGLRPGECYAISWDAIDWRTGKVPIRSTLQRSSDGLAEYPTKTAKSERDCYLPKWALDRLHQIWVGTGRPKGRVIGSLSPHQASYRISRWIARRRLPSVTMKNLRHTWGTIAAQSGVSIETVSAMMGHSSIQTTYAYYYSLTSATAKSAQRRVARRVMGKTCDDMYKGIDLVQPALVP